MRTFIIGDVHGNFFELRKLLYLLKLKGSTYIFVGDYINKGLYSKEVLSFLIKFSKLNKCIFLCGNHEYKLINKDIEFMQKYGGLATIKSYTNKNQVTEETLNKTIKIMQILGHYDFIQKLKLYYELDDYFIFHSGHNPKHLTLKDLLLNDIKSIIFSRFEFIYNKKFFERKKIIFGHTAFKFGYADNYKIGIDTGAGYDKELTAFYIEKELFISSNGTIKTLREIKNIGGMIYK